MARAGAVHRTLPGRPRCQPVRAHPHAGDLHAHGDPNPNPNPSPSPSPSPSPNPNPIPIPTHTRTSNLNQAAMDAAGVTDPGACLLCDDRSGLALGVRSGVGLGLGLG